MIMRNLAMLVGFILLIAALLAFLAFDIELSHLARLAKSVTGVR